MTSEHQTIPVDPARLASGQWCHRREKQTGEGDIHASYSADSIGMAGKVRKPFTWQGALWVCTGVTYRGDTTSHEAYRLVNPLIFDGTPVSYGERCRGARPPQGFYHGMSVKHGGQAYVLVGPPARFVAGQTEQLALF